MSSIVIVLLAAGCSAPEPDDAAAVGGPPSMVVTAANFDAGAVLSPGEYLSEPPYNVADIERGETLSLACVPCHTLRPDEDNLLGPNLGHVVGAAAASRPDFGYSAALAGSGLVWTPRSLDAWIAAPASFVPGTTMVFAGYASADDRRDLIAYLLRRTAGDGE